MLVRGFPLDARPVGKSRNLDNMKHHIPRGSKGLHLRQQSARAARCMQLGEYLHHLAPEGIGVRMADASYFGRRNLRDPEVCCYPASMFSCGGLPAGDATYCSHGGRRFATWVGANPC